MLTADYVTLFITPIVSARNLCVRSFWLISSSSLSIYFIFQKPVTSFQCSAVPVVGGLSLTFPYPDLIKKRKETPFFLVSHVAYVFLSPSILKCSCLHQNKIQFTYDIATTTSRILTPVPIRNISPLFLFVLLCIWFYGLSQFRWEKVCLREIEWIQRHWVKKSTHSTRK